MDPKPYKVLDDLYKLFEAREGKLTDKETGYFTGQMKALLDLYYEPEDHPDVTIKKPFKLNTIWKGEQ